MGNAISNCLHCDGLGFAGGCSTCGKNLQVTFEPRTGNRWVKTEGESPTYKYQKGVRVTNSGIQIPMNPPPRVTPKGFMALQRVLDDVMCQASAGKGIERHDNGNPWVDQPWARITDAVGLGFTLGQALKKIEESEGMEGDRKTNELLGAMHYIAMAIHHHRRAE